MQVELRDIRKRFGSVQANAGISLVVPSGSIQGILGENGAGKSTLMKILSGFVRPDSGEILLDGAVVSIRAPSDAIKHGIGMLHQDPLDVPPMRTLDNFILGREGGLFTERRSARAALSRLAAQFEFALDPDSWVDSLTVGERQQLEILRLLWLGARVLILDEPTTGISLPQKEKLFATLKTLAESGVTIIFVSHKLEDVELLCTRVAVLRRGELVGAMEPPFHTERLIELMFGRAVSFGGASAVAAGATVIALDGVTLTHARLTVRDVCLEIHAGEVVGLAGMEGSGQSVLLAACAGLLRPAQGTIRLHGRALTGRSHHAYRRHGAAFLPAARLEEGLVPGLTLTEHFILSEGLSGLFIDRAAAARVAQERIRLYDIKGRPESPVESLSGGNQQRMLLALLRTPLSLILLEHPTRGLDIESTMYIWSRLKERCAEGTAIVFVSTDLDEILRYSDRVIVFFAGRVSPPLQTDELTVEQLGSLIGGKGWERFEREALNA